jgi:hypothetical protein
MKLYDFRRGGVLLVLAGLVACAPTEAPEAGVASAESRSTANVNQDKDNDKEPGAGLPKAIASHVEGLLGRWKLTSQSQDSRCGPNADAQITSYLVAEAEWDVPGDITPTGAAAHFFVVECQGKDGWGVPYAASPSGEVPTASLSYVPADAAEPVCQFSTDWTKDPKIDPNLVFCAHTTIAPNRLEGVTKTLKRLVPIEPNADEPFYDFVPSDFAANAKAPRCTTALERTGSVLTYAYDCAGTTARFTFERAE